MAVCATCKSWKQMMKCASSNLLKITETATKTENCGNKFNTCRVTVFDEYANYRR